MSDAAESRLLPDAMPVPDLEKARTMAWEAHRLYVAGRASKLLIGLGGFAVIFGLLSIFNPKAVDSGFDNATNFFMLTAVAIFSALLFWLHRHTRRLAVAKGEPIVNFPPINRSFWYWFVSLSIIATAVAIIISNLDAEAFVNWAGGAVCALLWAVIFWHSFKYRLWEFALVAGGFMLSGVLILLFKETAFGWATLSYGLGSLIAGLSFHLRWRRWVKALPKNNGAAETGATVR